MKKIIIIVVAVLLLGGGGAGAYFFFFSEPDVAEEGTEVAVVEDERDPIFLKLDPFFVINIMHQGKLRYLQIGLEVMHKDQETIDDISLRMPMIRNNLIMILSEQSYDGLTAKTAMEVLRETIAESIGTVVGGKDGLEAPVEVFVTNFVIQ